MGMNDQTWHLVDVVVDSRGRYRHTTDGALHVIGGVRFVIPRVPCCYQDESWRANLYRRAHVIATTLYGLGVPSPELTIEEMDQGVDHG